MHFLRVRRALSACGLALLAGPLGAQEGWNDPRSLELVRAATARRALQLADTGLRDYTARATGTLTFLTQFGSGVFARPIVVMSDQLELEVYWGAPNRSKQRIVGRRDTLLLPSDMEYHRDHLGIIQNNFPDFIRLGEGDEVRDVVHPLSPLGPQTYDYRLSDSLSIRGGGVSLDVMMVSVRPKDPSQPAAVGAVYLDRESASVVRMTFSFTRSALLDRQLEDVSVILENGLVEGRYWLPRRQEIEIRRSASWMDFPATGIIRGRWEICCVRANVDLTPQQLAGAEIVEAGTAEQLRAYPFEGEVLDALPEDVRALDAPEVRAVQEEARRLVQAEALARVRRGNLSVRGLSDFVRANRVEGLAFGAGLSQRLGAGFAANVRGRYGTADGRGKAEGSLAWRRASGLGVTLTGRDDFAQLGETPEVSGLRGAIAAQEFGSDWTQPIGLRGGGLRVEWAPPGGRQWSLEFTRQDERALQVRAAPASGRFEPTVAAAEIQRNAATLGFALEASRPDAGRALRLSASATFSEFAPTGASAGSGTSGQLGRFSADLSWERPAFGGTLATRTLAAAVTQGTVPVQDLARFGGPVSGPGYDYHALVGGAGVSQRLEWQRSVPFVPIPLGRFGRVPGTLTLAPFAHAVWLDRATPGSAAALTRPGGADGGWHPALGLGVQGFFDLLRVDVARGLRDGRWTFSVDVARALWPVL